ncbi:MAG: hypothetical protein J0M00_04840 [Burkholderiales bacterium]|nr:hypothetical protein [Burkholderiales bacterium]
MRISRCLLFPLLLCTGGLALAEGGLKVERLNGYWSATQTQLQINAVVLDSTVPLSSWTGSAPMALSLGSDYYFSRQLLDDLTPRSGFRASSALLIRQPGVSLSELAWSARAIHRPAASLATGPYDPAAQGLSAMPYVGLGYSEHSLKTGWGFWADIGLVVQSPGQALGVGRVLWGGQSAEELMRELRLSPMLQLGVNYSF